MSYSDQKKGMLIAFVGIMFITPDSLFIRLATINSWDLIFYRGLIPFTVVFLGLLIIYKTSLLKEIINNGEVIRGYVGISAEIDYKGLGVLVKGVIPDSPADVSGIRSYDIIKKIDGNAVTEIKSVQKIIGSLKPGQIVDMQVEREGKLININILVSKMYYQ